MSSASSTTRRLLRQSRPAATAFGTKTRVLTVALVREPDNPYDANAVRVEAAEATVGHLSRDDAPRFHAIIDRLVRAGGPATCRGMLTGG